MDYQRDNPGQKESSARSVQCAFQLVHCLSQRAHDGPGGVVEIRTEADGGQYGVCLFPDGSFCEEWALQHRPELIVRLGASLVWRHVTERIAGDPEAERILVDPGRTWDDPDRLRWLANKLMEDPAQVVTVEGLQGPVTDTVENIVGRLGMPEMEYSYFTFATENNYMIWKFLKKTWEKGWLYRGADVMPWCPRCATGISQHEIVTDGYMELTHRSVTLRFPLHPN